MEFPNKKYKLIYMDPPWQYDDMGIQEPSRAIENHYPTMKLNDIIKLPIKEISDNNCVLFLWVTAPKVNDALELIKAWGFKYITCGIWDKKLIGVGYWFRNQHELIFIARKGKISPPQQEKRISSIYYEQRKEHSKKPVFYYTLLESMNINPKIELFARERRDGWDAWGNDVPPHKQKLL